MQFPCIYPSQHGKWFFYFITLLFWHDVVNPLLHVFPIGNNTIHIFLSARISDQEIKVYWGISKKLNPKNGRVKVKNKNVKMKTKTKARRSRIKRIYPISFVFISLTSYFCPLFLRSFSAMPASFFCFINLCISSTPEGSIGFASI